LESGFSPRRTLILSHGFDEEEVFARRGQGHIAPFLEKRYGQDSLLMVIDEGTGTSDDVSSSDVTEVCLIYGQMFGAPFAMPGMGEKGYMDIIVCVLDRNALSKPM
jgi:Gly-Xaa carboxypeptidase